LRTAFFEAIGELAARNPRLMLITGDLGFGQIEAFASRFPRQYLNIGVAEQNMAGIAAGLALGGRQVFLYSIGNFPTLRCLEQIRNDICYHQATVTVVAVGGGLAYGSLGMSHHVTEDLAIMRALPHMTVLAPGDPIEASWATSAAAAAGGPCYLRLGRAGERRIHADGQVFVMGRALQVREGRDVTLISTGGMLELAVRVAERLHDESRIEARVLSMHTVKPLDEAAVHAAARSTGAIVTLEEHSIIGGLGGAVAEVLAEAGVGIPFKRVGLPSTFVSRAGSHDYLKALFGLSESSVLETVGQVLYNAATTDS
jgi:transketolase